MGPVSDQGSVNCLDPGPCSSKWNMHVCGVGCTGFANKNFSLQSETKRNEIRLACVSHAHAKTKILFSLLFASNFSLPIKAKLIKRIFSLCFASKNFTFRFFFVLFSLNFNLVSL